MKTAHHRRARVFWPRAKAFLTAAIETLNANHAVLTAIATMVLAVATIVLAVATCSLVRISENTDVTLHDTLVAANRAWVTPAAAFLVDVPAAGKGVRYRVQYGNSGKEPATGFVAQEDAGIIDAPTPQDTLYTILPKNKFQDVCARTHAAREGGVVYPAREDYTYTASADRLTFTPEIQNGSKLIFAHGCFAYETFQRERKSEYCFIFLNAARGDTQGVHCQFGNTAN
jgi:hypothetical protein